MLRTEKTSSLFSANFDCLVRSPTCVRLDSLGLDRSGRLETLPDVGMGDLYAAQYGQYEPAPGNVVFLFPGNAERYLTDLAALGLLALSQNPAWSSAPLVEVAGR